MDDLLLLIISSPSGAGKTTLTRELLSAFTELRFSVSHTTRPPRGSEVDGREYHFVDQAKFDGEVAADSFVEWAEVHGNRYGTSVGEIDLARKEGKVGLLFDVDYQGARQIKAKLPGAVGVFILPPSMEVLARRLRGRGTDDPESIERRLAKAEAEIEHYRLFDYVIVNDDLQSSISRLKSVVWAEASRCGRMAGAGERLLRDKAVGEWPFKAL